MNLAVDHTWDARMRVLGRVAVLAAIVIYLPIMVGLPLLLVITLPAGAFAMRRLQRDTKKVGVVTDTSIARKRKTRAIIVVAAVAVFAIGLVIDALPSQATHDEYWALFVAPSMIAFMVGVVALPMLVWSWLPRRAGGNGS